MVKFVNVNIIKLTFQGIFYFQEVDNEFLFVYNNHPQNLANPDEKPKISGGLSDKKHLVSLTIVDENDNQEYLSLFDEKPSKRNRISPRKMYILSDNEAIWVKKRGKRTQLIKYTFQNPDKEKE